MGRNDIVREVVVQIRGDIHAFVEEQLKEHIDRLVCQSVDTVIQRKIASLVRSLSL